MTQLLTHQFAEFACGLRDIPKEVSHQADRAILDTMGVMIAGAEHQTTKTLAQAEWVHSGPAPLVTGGSTTPDMAALINGTAAHVWDFDDTSYTGIMHGSAVILPVVLALAARQQSDPDLQQKAFVAGSEIAYALADICGHSHYFKGWWSTVTFGLIGATAAAGVMLQLDQKQMSAALGIAAASAAGGKAVFGTDGKPFLVGEAAKRAIDFARAAKLGVTGPANGFEDTRGFLGLLGDAAPDFAQANTLGQRWRLTTPGLLFKTNPVCSAAHAGIELMNTLMSELNATAEDIALVEADVPELVYISLVYANPNSPQQAQFSLPFAVACAARFGKVRFEDLWPGAQQTPELKQIMEKIIVRVAPDLSTEEARRKHPECTRLKVTLADGRTADGFCKEPLGMPGNPLSDELLIQKFESSIAYAGRNGAVEAELGLNPAQTFARLSKRPNPTGEKL